LDTDFRRYSQLNFFLGRNFTWAKFRFEPHFSQDINRMSAEIEEIFIPSFAHSRQGP